MKEISKVLRDKIIKQMRKKSYRAIAKALNIAVSITGVNNNPRTCPPCKISQCALRVMLKKVREKPAVIQKELQGDLKAAGTTIQTEKNKQ